MSTSRAVLIILGVAPTFTEVSAGLQQAHCDHADFSDYTILDMGELDPPNRRK